MSKSNAGNFFEDFRLGQVIEHATPRTVTTGDAALYVALYGARFAVQSSDAFAQAIGYPRAPVDDFLVVETLHLKTGWSKSIDESGLTPYTGLTYIELKLFSNVLTAPELTDCVLLFATSVHLPFSDLT